MAQTDSTINTAPPPGKTGVESVRDTLESIVIAFILAFIFRAFIVEAFVIPTGSMGPTLHGAQRTHTCSTCGFEYSVGMTDFLVNKAAQPGSIVEVRLRCPNCDMERDTLSTGQLARPASGDRILVHKWITDLPSKALGPKRWDVTVFKNPQDGQQNYIKRLVGLPGEVLEIIEGDIYTAPLEDLPDEMVQELNSLRVAAASHESSYMNGGGALLERYREFNDRLLPYLRIQRKLETAPAAQEALWFNVYNHDYLPQYSERATERQRGTLVGWQPVGAEARQAWRTNQRVLSFSSPADEALFIEFVGKPIDDYYAYNLAATNFSNPGKRAGYRTVGDIRLSFTWLPTVTSGDLIVKANRDENTFIATFSVDGQVKLEAEGPDFGLPGKPETLDGDEVAPFTGRRSAPQIEFVNVDYQVAVRVDGQKIVGTNQDQYYPQVEKLREICDAGWDRTNYGAGGSTAAPLATEVRIGGRSLECNLMHVVLERDVYYRSPHHQQQRSDQRRNEYAGWPGWGTTGMPIMLRVAEPGDEFQDEFFMLGDNSPHSEDSRLWTVAGDHLKAMGTDYQLGTVPRDQLIGEAFFVYWPAGYRRNWAGGIGLIPNFGQMRWIK